MGGSFTPDPGEIGHGWLTAIDASTGAIRWRYRSRRPMLAAVTATSSDLLFTGELDGDFLVLDGRDARPETRPEALDAVTVSPDPPGTPGVTSEWHFSLWKTCT